MIRARIVSVLLAAGWVWLTGCATYINIPRVPGDVAENDPNHQTALKVQQEALRGIIDDMATAPAGPFRVQLPPGTTDASAQIIAGSLGERVASQPDSLPTLEVKQVRVRGQYAQVDIVRPSNPLKPAASGGPLQLASVNLKYDWISGWRAQHIHIWRMPVDEALRQSLRLTQTQVAPPPPITTTENPGAEPTPGSNTDIGGAP